MLLLSSLWALARAEPATPAGPALQRWVAWPTDDDLLRNDGVIFLGELEPGLADPLFTDLDGVAVAFGSRILLGTGGNVWRVLVPDEPLAAGVYTLALEQQVVLITVVDRPADVGSPPTPYRRWTAVGCDGAPLSYRVCGGGVLHLAATGDIEPPAPSLDDLGSALVVGAGEDRLGIAEAFGTGDGWSGTVWVGDLDEAGRFTGWWAGDPVELVADGIFRTEAPAGTTATPGVTSTSVVSCPPFASWEVLAEVECDPPEAVLAPQCACRTGGSASGAWILGLALATRRRARLARCMPSSPAPAAPSGGPSSRR